MKAYLTVAAICLLGSGVLLRAEQTSYGKLNAEAVQLYNAGKYEESAAKGEEALKLAEQTLAPDDKDLVVILENLAAGYAAAKKLDKAQAMYERVLANKEKDTTAEPASVARTLFSLGDLELDQKNWPSAASYYQRCLAIRDKSLGPDHADTIFAVSRLALVYQNQEKYTEELPLLERERVAWEKSKGADSAEVGRVNQYLGFVSGKLKRKADMERYYNAALAIRQKHPGEKDEDLINSLQVLATHYRLQEKYLTAEPLYKQLLALQEKNLGKDNPELLPTLRGYLELQGWTEDDGHKFQQMEGGLHKRNVADALMKRIHHLESAEGQKDEPPKSSKPAH
jgi:hypothetical protein